MKGTRRARSASTIATVVTAVATAVLLAGCSPTAAQVKASQDTVKATQKAAVTEITTRGFTKVAYSTELANGTDRYNATFKSCRLVISVDNTGDYFYANAKGKVDDVDSTKLAAAASSLGLKECIPKKK